MSAKEALIGHPREDDEDKPVIDWGLARYRNGRRGPTGPLADLLAGTEIEAYARGSVRTQVPPARPDYWGRAAVSPFEQLVDAIFLRLRKECSVDFPMVDTLDIEESAGRAADGRLRRAWLCLEILADRNCPLIYPGHEVEELRKRVWDPVASDERARSWVQLHRLSMRAGRPTSHLVRPGGFVETDLGWMAGVKSRPQRVRVREQLEELGAVRRIEMPGKQPRFLPANCPASKVRLRMRGSMRDDVRGFGKLALESAPGQRARGRLPEKWDFLPHVPGGPVFVVGVVPAPSARRFIEREIAGFRRAWVLREGKIARFRIARLLRTGRRAQGGDSTRPFLVIPL